MGEVESALFSYEKTRRKVEDNSEFALLAYDQNQREKNVVKGSSSRGKSKFKDCKKGVQCTSARSGDT